jgi:SH3-like domain-containing protein
MSALEKAYAVVSVICAASAARGSEELCVRLASMLMGAAVLVAGLLSPATASLAANDSGAVGSVTKLQLPRYVSLKADSVNLREGPNRDHPVKWIFKRAGLPVEVTAEFEQWRRIRDSEGTEGWVLQNLLSGRRTALISPWTKDGTFPLYDGPDANSAVVARLQPRVLASVHDCARDWCRLKSPQFDGYIQEDKLWGVYPHESVE